MSSTGDVRVVCAALRRADGLILPGVRHLDPGMRELITRLGGPDAWRGAEQGFLTNTNDFVSRADAYQIAVDAGQLICWPHGRSRHLFSEYLY